jgi:hypothetical protein
MLDAQSKKILHFVSYFSHHKQAIAKVLRANAVYLYYEVLAAKNPAIQALFRSHQTFSYFYQYHQ